MLSRFLYGSLSTRLVLTIGIPASLFLAGILSWVALRDFRQALEHTRQEAVNLTRLQTARLDLVLGEAALIPEMHAAALESGILRSPADIERYLTGVVARHRNLLYGSCLAFEPHQFLPDAFHYCPYAYWHNGQPTFTLLQPPAYDHFQWHWYQNPKRTGRPEWTEPFYDEGGGNVLMTTRTVPIFRTAAPDQPKTFWGVATIDISLDSLIANLNAVKVAQTGYAFLISPSGRYLSHPDPKIIFKTRIQDQNPDLARQMLGIDNGFLRQPDPVNQRDSWIAFRSVQNGGFILGLVYPHEEITQRARQSLLELISIALVGVVALFGALTFISQSVTRPIRHLATVAGKIANGDLNQMLDHKVGIREVRYLTVAFSKMSRDLQTRMEELRQSTMHKARLTGELNAARRIQTSMLPREWSAQSSWPHHQKVSLDAIMQPAREIGGDFYDHRFIDERRLAILIGDVSGKGVPAALFMAMTQTLFKGSAGPDLSVVSVMQRVNEALSADTHTGMFVTLVYAVLDVLSGELELCNAGHSTPLLLGSTGDIRPLRSDRHPALGLKRHHHFTSARFHMPPGEKIFFYTDGVTEAFNQNQELFGEQRLLVLLRRLASKPVEELTRDVILAVHEYSKGEENSDDITVLALNLLS